MQTLSTIPAFLERFADEKTVCRLVTDHVRESGEGSAAGVFPNTTRNTPWQMPELQEREAQTADRLLTWSRTEGLSESLVAEAYVDYWFLHTVVDSVAEDLARAGGSIRQFLETLNGYIADLSGLCPDVTPPAIAFVDAGRGEMLLRVKTPRYLASGLVPGMVARLNRIFVDPVTIEPLPHSLTPAWRVRFGRN